MYQGGVTWWRARQGKVALQASRRLCIQLRVILVSKSILVIEDDSITLRLIRYTLEQEGYQILTATNGLEGLRKAQMN